MKYSIDFFKNKSEKKKHLKKHCKKHSKKSCKKCNDCEKSVSCFEHEINDCSFEYKSCENACNKNYIEITDNITSNTLLRNCNIYIIKKPIRVCGGVKLSIENNVLILLVNKLPEENILIPENFDPTTNLNLILTGSSLIFESGSQLCAENLYINTCNDQYIIQSVNNNCGIYFMGTSTESQYNILDIHSSIRNYKSNYRIKNLYLNYIGSLYFLVQNTDDTFVITNNPNLQTQTIITAIPLNSITILGCRTEEFTVKNIFCENAGSNGLWSQYSKFEIESLKIIGYQGNALLIRGNQIIIKKKLYLIQNIVPVFPLYNGVLINISELVGNKPDILPFPPNTYTLPKDFFLSSITLLTNIKLYLYEPVNKFRDTVRVIESRPPETIFSNDVLGTFYKGIINKQITLTRNNLNLLT